MKTVRRIWQSKAIQNHYGIYLLVAVEIFLSVVVFGCMDDLVVAINDNLDSNIPLMKMFRDNNCWIDRTTPLPFLGGVDRSVLTCGYTLSYINYWLFDTQFAYWLNFLEAIAIATMGFYFLGVVCKKITQKDISPNFFCVIGLAYSLLGFWPHALFGFALIPWWTFLVLEIYLTRKWWLSFFFIPLIYNISGPLIGVFLVFYTMVFFIIVLFREKKLSKQMLLSAAIMLMSFVLVYCKDIVLGINGSKETIKSLASNDGFVYNDNIRSCLSRFPDVLFLRRNISLYHSGLSAFQYTAMPIVFLFFILFNLERKKMKISKDFLFVYNFLSAALVFNAFVMAFDTCRVLRKMIPFFSGFSFQRIMWLSPFILSLGVILVLFYLLKKKFLKLSVFLVLALFAGILQDYNSGLNAIYNFSNMNYYIAFKHHQSTVAIRWNDYYAQDLFEEVKNDINYQGEWVVSFRIDPSVLQYNSFKTLDGYYSNYSVEYKKKWEKLIAPSLEADVNIRSYWQSSNGQRALIYPSSVEQSDSESVIDDAMLIDRDVLRELGGKYVISNYQILNANDLNFEYLGTWKNDNFPQYTLVVYKVLN